MKLFTHLFSINENRIYDIDDLIHACEFERANRVKECLKQGIDVNAYGRNKTTALITASKSNNLTILQLLLDVPNINVNIQDNTERTALMWASYMGYTSIVKEILKRSDVDVDLKNNANITALMYASANGYVEIVRLLLEYGADTKVKNYVGKTALDLGDNLNIKQMIIRLDKSKEEGDI